MFRALSTLLVLFGIGVAQAAVPAGYRFASIADQADDPVYAVNYGPERISLGTAINNNGHLFGFRVTEAGILRSFNIAFGTNPKMTSVETDNFVALSGSDTSCWWIFCTTEYPFGMRVLDDGTAVTAFLNTVIGTSPLPGSLPYALFPGNFVEENRNGIVASTQVDLVSQFGAFLHPGGVTVLADVPWLAGINDLAHPLALGYDGLDGDCLVFGENCAPLPEECEADGSDTHSNTTGRGHESHGRGHGYGHYKCRSDADADGADGAGTGSTAILPDTGALLLRLSTSDYSVSRYRFPRFVTAGDALYAARLVFPLAINDSRAILRGDVVLGDGTLDQRLLSCSFDGSAPDADGDGVVDCIGGLQLVGGVAGSIRVGTVLGFSLNNAQTLAGNLGYSAAGIGAPFVVDVAAAVPVPVLLSNLATGSAGWEIHNITDLNQNGRMIGYGYRDCGAFPQAFFIDPGTAPASTIRFHRGAFERPALLETGDLLLLAPTVSGGSGLYEFRIRTRTPADSEWTLLSDWSADASVFAPAENFRGDVCFHVEARDALAPESSSEMVVRYRVVDPLPAGGGTGDGDTVDAPGTDPDAPVSDSDSGDGGSNPGSATGSSNDAAPGSEQSPTVTAILSGLRPANGDSLDMADFLAAPGGLALGLLFLLSLRRRRA
ncbi:MAG: hypothetical protein ACLGHG_03805 [Gammaproteobacteria bacterium]